MEAKLINDASVEVKKLIKSQGENLFSDYNRCFGLISDTLVGEKYRLIVKLVQKGVFSGAYEMIIKAPAPQRRTQAGRAKQQLMDQELMSEEFATDVVNILLGALDIKLLECATVTVTAPEPERDPFECTGCGNKIQIMGNMIPKFCNMCGTPWTAPANFDPSKMTAPTPKPAPAPMPTFLHTQIGSSNEYYIDTESVTRRDMEEVDRLILSGRKLEAVKFVRSLGKFDLKESKAWVESYPHIDLTRIGNPLKSKGPVQNGYSIGTVKISKANMDDIDQMMALGMKLDAIKFVRELSGYCLSDAKEWLENNYIKYTK